MAGRDYLGEVENLREEFAQAYFEILERFSKEYEHKINSLTERCAQLNLDISSPSKENSQNPAIVLYKELLKDERRLFITELARNLKMKH